MKTKIFAFFLLIFSISWGMTSASHVHVYLNNSYSPEYHYFCSIDTVIVHKPSIAASSIKWNPPIGSDIFDSTSVIITSINTGTWSFYADEVDKTFYIYILTSPPYEPACTLNDTSFCTSTFSLPLDAENQNPGGHAATYEWRRNGIVIGTNRTVTVTTPGTYSVTITNACGVNTYTKNVTQANPNAPHLGVDQTFCWGLTSTLDPGSTNVASYLWSTGATSDTLVVDTTGTYWVYVMDNNGCSGRDTVEITTLIPTPAPICFVEFDTLTWKNNINWSINLPSNADSVRIYKETSLGVWTLIGTVHKSIHHFLDMASAPQAQSYSYKIAMVDNCGNESELSSYHTTITLLSAYDQGTSTYGFNWSAYHGLIVGDYYLFGIDGANVITQVATVPGNVYMYNYVNPNLSFVKYYIGFEAPNCTNKTNVIVKSNWVQSVLTSVKEITVILFSVYPNPANDQININIGIDKFQVEVLTILGQVVLHEHNVKTLNIESLTNGVYIISITANGVRTNKRFIKQ